MRKLQIVFSKDESLLAERLKAYPAVFVVADRKIKDFLAEPLVETLAERGVAVRAVKYLRTGERRKNLSSVEKLLEWLLKVGADRNALVLCVGGGITSDLGGFAACIYKRGVRYANVPTTLLAQVDAAIGGKTGCNVDSFKNMAGLICQPEFTFINPDYVRSLSWEDYCCGYAEMLKTFIIGDPVAYEDAIALTDPEKLPPLIESAVNIKREIVERDEKESGDRRLLNLGHSFAHAIECKSKGRIPHGFAVSIGIIMAARKSEKEKIAKKGLTAKLISDFEAVGLPVDCKWSEEELSEIIRKDKKAEDGHVHYVLIEEIGKVKVF